ncbi:hypothetical protein F3Y22_tig00112611pilonHSYRG00036 [Hibiscus syriacus]|uniref:Uncharacterized protein n=1 Tax=Hibiscus syriacus TaxID=106335 RepID=A0A6A2WV80_HIBSY|nr:hypothetical protein F3Y22_tig00112611pilonHSYRG00036 [Hibiscus syriacus]
MVDSGSVYGDGTGRPANFSDEEVMLASSCPKKRAGRKKFRETHLSHSGDGGACAQRGSDSPERKVGLSELRGLGLEPSVAGFFRPEDIQKTAAKVAETFRTAMHSDGNSTNKSRRGENTDMEKTTVSDEGFYWDEEAQFGTQRFWANMAAGMMMSPPRCGHDGEWEQQEYDAADDYVPLWSYSI